MSNEVALLTGGCGFIGTWTLRALLERGLSVVVLDMADRPARWERVIGAAAESVKLVRGDLTDRALVGQLLDEHRVTRVIHLAALLTPDCQRDPWLGCQVNIVGTLALLEEIRARAGAIRGFSYASSLAVYGAADDPVSQAPSGGGEGPEPRARAGAGEHRSSTFYGAFKKSVELIVEQYGRHYKIPSLGLRPHVVYGPERESGLSAGPSLAARAAALGESYRIGYSGWAGYDYVEDVAAAFVRGACEPPDGAPVVNLPSQGATVQEILAALDEIVPGAAGRISADGPRIPESVPPRPSPIEAIYPDWRPTSLAEGMRRTIEFYRTRGAAFRP